jgi:phosphoglycolate phosphatase-like HAD superfamily hydrolase
MNKLENKDNVKRIIWDADNTLWDWVGYAVHAYEAMADCISKETGIPEPEVAAAMKRFYTDAQTIENPWLIQGMHSKGLFKNVKKFDLDDLIEKAQNIFNEQRRKYLKLYPGIKQLLSATKESGIQNDILTDAPSFQAARRIVHFGLHKNITNFYTMPAAHPTRLPKKFLERQLKGKYSLPFNVKEIHEEKPNTDLEELLQMTRAEIARHVVIIGDNPKKDIALAQKYGCRAIHASYGLASPQHLQRLLRFSPERATKRNVATQGAKDTCLKSPLIVIAHSIEEIRSSLIKPLPHLSPRNHADE